MKLTLRQIVSLLSFIVLVSFLSSCKKEASPKAKEAVLNVIPKPLSVQPAEGAYVITGKTTVYADMSIEGISGVAEYITSTLGVQLSETRTGGDQVYLSIVTDAELGDEGYEIDVNSESISISANKPAGLFYAVQTLRQMGVKTADGTEFGAVKIRDYPTFGWRGSMLDVARHFFGVEDVKRYIDLMATYKLNVLHLHLSDDQGWRIEIKSWPKLTEIGGKTQVGGNGGGFYTQEQYKDLVAYGQSRFINIIPEIDMPSHVEAALASYPELSCDGRKPALYEGTAVGFNSLCPKGEIVSKFVADVVKEIASLTPGPYFHVGGDEASKVVKKDDYIQFVKTFKKIVQANNKYMIGWEEVSQSDIGPGDLVQYWHSAEHAVEGVKKGAKLIMSPSTKVYLDMKYDTTIKHIGYDWAALIEVDAAYNWKIEEMIPGVGLENVVGVEAPLWSETLKSMDDIEFMLFPRLPGIAEMNWNYENRNWDEYKVRLGKHGKFMTDLGINFYKSPKVTWE
jgi:hexosaminidase